MLSLVGVDPVQGAPRFTFGMTRLMDGIKFVPVVMGFFGIGEILLNAEKALNNVMADSGKGHLLFSESGRMADLDFLHSPRDRTGIFPWAHPGDQLGRRLLHVLYHRKEGLEASGEVRHGVIEGVAAPETANNAYANAALIPLFTLGLPGSPTIAILMGALIMNGLMPGPLLFKQHAPFVWAVIASLYIGNVILLILNLPLVGWWAKLLKIPYQIAPVLILIFCIVGAYSLDNNLFDVGVMIVCGILGYLFKKLDFPLAPAILTLILGPMLERSLRESLSMSQGDFSIFFVRPISLFFLVITAIILLTSGRKALLGALREESKEAQV